MKKLELLPTDKVVQADNFYVLPREIENFIIHTNRELPTNWKAMPWTLNRAVTIFYMNNPMFSTTYEQIFNNIIAALDEVQININEIYKSPAFHWFVNTGGLKNN